ncbi:alpha-galactosidase [Paenibacillus koleovorans]|uniref:alpha-galactosidase n=1 Tax=Paenibacillus koleovorans TaxID=121608 RepID=UPI000FDC86BA|nr:hypothetical protein [Paenibacillus koleovorans]
MMYRMKNKWGTFTFDAGERCWSYGKGEEAWIESMEVTIELDGQPVSCFDNIASIESYEQAEDIQGIHQKLVLFSRLKGDYELDCSVTFKVYTEDSFMSAQVSLSNVTGGTPKLGKCQFRNKESASSSEIRIGRQLSETVVLCQSAWVTNNMVKRLDADPQVHTSKTIGLLYNPTSKLALNTGFLTFDRINTEVVYEYTAEGTILLQAYCDFDGYELLPEARIDSEVAAFEMVDDPFVALENWASRVNRQYKPIFANKPSVGWIGGWTWRDGFSQQTYEELVLENTTAIQERLGGFGVSNIWVSIANLKDMLPGNWMEENREAFPHGWKWLIEKLKRNEQRLGFWIAPFWIPDKLNGLYEEHANHLLKMDGKQIRFDSKWRYGKSGELPVEERAGFYSLDGSHPGTREFLQQVFEFYEELGIRYYMTDFLFAGSGTTPGHFIYNEYHDRTMVKGPEVYREALRQIRQAAGEDTYILSSTGTTFQNVGCVDAVRVAVDCGEGRPLIKGMNEYPAMYTINPWNVMRDVASNMAATYFTDRKLYYNDAFNVMTIDKPIPLNEARITASMFGLSGGPIMLGDEIVSISEERLNLIKKCLPQYEKMAKPADLFTSVYPDWPKVFNLKVSKPWEEWQVVGLLNTEPTTKIFELAMHELDLDSQTDYTVFDFWDEMYLGEARGTLTVEVPPYSIKVLRVSQARNHPWLLSSDMHITQGGVELEQLKWNPEKRYLQGVCVRPRGETGNLYFRLPKWWKPVRYDGLRTAKVPMDKSVLVMKRIDFPVETVTWRIDFELDEDVVPLTARDAGEEREVLA